MIELFDNTIEWFQKLWQTLQAIWTDPMIIVCSIIGHNWKYITKEKQPAYDGALFKCSRCPSKKNY
jgi:hypothetical protein